MNNKALLIIGHGSRSVDAVQDFNRIVECVREKSEFKTVVGAHMELAEPSIEDTAKQLHEAGISKVIVAPYFLFHGNHIKQDIPEILDKVREQYPEMEFLMAKPIGFEPVLADILIKRAGEVA